MIQKANLEPTKIKMTDSLLHASHRHTAGAGSVPTPEFWTPLCLATFDACRQHNESVVVVSVKGVGDNVYEGATSWFDATLETILEGCTLAFIYWDGDPIRDGSFTGVLHSAMVGATTPNVGRLIRDNALHVVCVGTTSAPHGLPKASAATDELRSVLGEGNVHSAFDTPSTPLGLVGCKISDAIRDLRLTIGDIASIGSSSPRTNLERCARQLPIEQRAYLYLGIAAANVLRPNHIVYLTRDGSLGEISACEHCYHTACGRTRQWVGV